MKSSLQVQCFAREFAAFWSTNARSARPSLQTLRGIRDLQQCGDQKSKRETNFTRWCLSSRERVIPYELFHQPTVFL